MLSASTEGPQKGLSLSPCQHPGLEAAAAQPELTLGLRGQGDGQPLQHEAPFRRLYHRSASN